MMMPNSPTISDYWATAGAAEIEAAACAQFGQPNLQISTRKQLRFGNRGSKAVDLLGDKAGLWHNFENGTGGALTPPRGANGGFLLPTLPAANCAPKRALARTTASVTDAFPEDLTEDQRVRDAQEIYDRANSNVTGTPGEQYLVSRGIEDLAEIEGGAGVRWLDDGRCPSLVFPVHDLTGGVIAIHRVLVHDDGSPAIDHRTGKKLKYSLGPVGLGFYFARQSIASDARWVVTEGPEDALSVASWFADWDTLDVNLVATCGPLAARAGRLLGNIEDVTLWAEPGQHFACAEIARRCGWKIVLGEGE